jgi:hypothetical protein
MSKIISRIVGLKCFRPRMMIGVYESFFVLCLMVNYFEKSSQASHFTTFTEGFMLKLTSSFYIASILDFLSASSVNSD